MKKSSVVQLENRRILVVEDEYMIAEEIVSVLRESGAEALGPVPSVAGALGLLAAQSKLDGAVLDINLRGEEVWPLVDALLARNVPIVLATGYDVGAIPVAYSGLPRCEKPATGHELARSLSRALAA